MSARPILFSGRMVRALLEGRKTQTRRVITLQRSFIDGSGYSPRGIKFGIPVTAFWSSLDWARAWKDNGPSPAGNPGPYLHVPYPREGTAHRIYPRSQPGDTLWVRETWYAPPKPLNDCLGYAADGDHPHGVTYRRRPSIFMPRAASRLTLRITKVRVERLHEISEADAMAEGLAEVYRPHPVLFFRELWEGINGPSGFGWAANPWVWVLEFEQVTSRSNAIRAQA